LLFHRKAIPFPEDGIRLSCLSCFPSFPGSDNPRRKRPLTRQNPVIPQEGNSISRGWHPFILFIPFSFLSRFRQSAPQKGYQDDKTLKGGKSRLRIANR
jgi:hypothetical protein